MKSYIPLLIGVALALLSMKLRAQGCGTGSPDPEKQKMLPSYKILSNKATASNARIADYAGTKYRFKVMAHALVKPATSNTSVDLTNISTSDIENKIVELNKAFDPVNFEFVLCGINYIKVSDHNMKIHTNYDDTGDEEIYCDPYDEPGHINIYFFNEMTMGDLSITGKADFPEYDREKNIVTGSRILFHHSYGKVLIHEMGHFFNLFHTSESIIYGKERVDGFDCTTKGDKLCDTPAEPHPTDEMLKNGQCYFNSSCNYTGTVVDPAGKVYSPLKNNHMSVSPLDCRTSFTSGQISRMQVTGLYDRNDLLIPYQTEFNYNIKGNYFYPGPGAVVNVNTVASSILTSTSIISEASNIKYYADEKIVLKNGFKVEKGSSFKAKYIDFCDMPNRKDGVIMLNPLRMLYDPMEEEEFVEESIPEDNSWMKVYPNPNSGTGTIRFNSEIVTPSSVSIFDNFGRKVQVINCDQQTLSNQEINFDMMQYPSGMYSAVIEAGGKVYSSQFVIAK